jgi:hypothetical protein
MPIHLHNTAASTAAVIVIVVVVVVAVISCMFEIARATTVGGKMQLNLDGAHGTVGNTRCH